MVKKLIKKINKVTKPITKKDTTKNSKETRTPKTTSSNYIAWFKDLSKDDLPTVGGKGANLGEMYKVMPVPNGFCITVAAYDAFIKSSGIVLKIFQLLKSCNKDNQAQLDTTSETIRNLILKSKMPQDIELAIKNAYKELKSKFVAVRSSATAEDLPTASFAGQQDTYLNISGEKEIVNAVQRCWASLFTSRAIFYREQNKFKHEDVKISIVVQTMVESEKAGVMFTVNPVNKDYNQMIIEGSYGLGESVVSGQVTPDTYIVEKTPFKIIDINIGSKSTILMKGKNGKNKTVESTQKQKNAQLLTETEIKMLATLGLKIEAHYKKPQDIEWAILKGKPYILQSRPITTL